MSTRVVLEREPDTGAHLEVALLPAQTPDDLPASPIDLVHRRGVARGNEQVAVLVDADRVEVEIVPAVSRREIRLSGRDVICAVPLQQHLAACDVDLLEHSLDQRTGG